MLRFPRHSLYWRIALGFMLCIAIILAIQGSVLLLMVARADPDSRTNFTLRVANDIAREIDHEGAIDVDAFVRTNYSSPPRAFYVVMVDGRVIEIGDAKPQPAAVANVIREFQSPGLTAIPRNWEVAPYWAAPILVEGLVVGTVAVVPQNLVKEIGPRLAIIGALLLIVGTLLAAQFIFAPAHRRLLTLESAARELGAGHLDARATVDGLDEVSSLGRVFNKMADAIAAHAEEMAASDRTRRLLLADVSHELMTPLTALRGYEEKLAADERIRGAADLCRFVGILGEETHRVERIVRDLLDLARLEGGGGSLDLQDVSIEGLLGRVAARHEAAAAERDIQLAARIEPGAELVFGDPFRLEQALQNLAANALRHVRAGGCVELDARLVAHDVEISVRDTGSGIAREHLPFVFDRFYKTDPSRAVADAGSGLGLSIVKAIVERHGGTVSVRSQPGVETVFAIRLPASGMTSELAETVGVF